MVARSGNTYSTGSGTSFAAPFVSGVVALMRSINSNLSPTEVEFIIKATADPIADASQFPGQLGAGRINAFEACKMANCNFTSVQGYLTVSQTGPPTTKIVFCKEITVFNNAIIPNNLNLVLVAADKVTVSDLTIMAGGTLEIYCTGTVSIDYGTFKVMEGATFIIR